MSRPSPVFPRQSTEATAPAFCWSLYWAVQVSQRTFTSRRCISAVAAESVVYATDMVLNPPGSHATMPIAATATPGRSHQRLNAPMHGSVPLGRAAR